MRTAKFFTQAYFNELKLRCNALIPASIKRPFYLWPLLCLYFYVSYNSCNIRYSIFNQRNEALAVTAMKDSLHVFQSKPQVNNRKTIYLTFDDGPNGGTANVMRVLAKNHVPATFFLVGSHIHGSERQRQLFHEIQSNPAFEAANHTYFHAKNQYNKFYKKPQLALEDFRLMRDSVHLNSPIGRTPGCDTWRTSEITEDIDRRSTIAANLLKADGFKLVGWDVEWKADSKKRPRTPPQALAAEIEQNFEDRATKTDGHLVLLLHDQHYADSKNVKELDELIIALKEKYEFNKVSGYPCL